MLKSRFKTLCLIALFITGNGAGLFSPESFTAGNYSS